MHVDLVNTDLCQKLLGNEKDVNRCWLLSILIEVARHGPCLLTFRDPSCYGESTNQQKGKDAGIQVSP